MSGQQLTKRVRGGLAWPGTPGWTHRSCFECTVLPKKEDPKNIQNGPKMDEKSDWTSSRISRNWVTPFWEREVTICRIVTRFRWNYYFQPYKQPAKLHIKIFCCFVRSFVVRIVSSFLFLIFKKSDYHCTGNIWTPANWKLEWSISFGYSSIIKCSSKCHYCLSQ